MALYSQPYHTRMAPTPSGFLHAGNIFNFILNWRIARLTGGTVRLRIDDMDTLRMRIDYIEAIFTVLDYLGLDYDWGPKNVSEQLQIYSQSLSTAFYQQHLDKLIHSNNAFACVCSRKDILYLSSDGKYPGTCRNKTISLEKPYAWRLKVEPSAVVHWVDCGQQRSDSVYAHFPDPVLWRKENLPAYTLVSVIDDYRHGINCIIRGADLLDSTIVQMYLMEKLQFPKPLFCLHHPLIQDSQGNKLSKSAGSTSVFSWIGKEKVAQWYHYLSKILDLPASSNAITLADAWIEKQNTFII